jgi:hypothetical protein
MSPVPAVGTTNTVGTAQAVEVLKVVDGADNRELAGLHLLRVGREVFVHLVVHVLLDAGTPL